MLTTWTGLDAEMAFHTVPVRIPLVDVYRDVEFPERPPNNLAPTRATPADSR